MNEYTKYDNDNNFHHFPAGGNVFVYENDDYDDN